METHTGIGPDGYTPSRTLRPLQHYCFGCHWVAGDEPGLDGESYTVAVMGEGLYPSGCHRKSLARANNTRIRQHKPEDIDKLVNGATIEIWREPEVRGEVGWRGPAHLIKRHGDHSKGIVEW